MTETALKDIEGRPWRRTLRGLWQGWHEHLRGWRSWGPWNRRRRRTPTLLQMQETECGAACLGIILGYYGRHEPLETLRYECGVTRDGAKASNVLRAARGYGLTAKGFALNAMQVSRAPLPLVSLWNFTHFVVVEGFVGGKVYLNDPATGPRTVSEQRFVEGYSGVSLAFLPGSGFTTNRRPPGAMASLLERTRSSRRAYAFIILASLIFFLPGLMMPAFLRIYVDYFLVQGQDRWLTFILASMLATALFTGVLVWLLDNSLIRFYTKLQTLWSSRMVWRILRLPLSYFDQRSGGDLSTRIQSNGMLAWLVAGELSSTFLGLATLLVYALIMWQYDVLLTLIGMGFAAVNLIAFWIVSRRLEDINQQLHRDRGKTAGILMQGLRSIDSYQANGTEAVFFNRWAGHQAKVANARQSLGKTRALLTAIPLLLAMVSTTAILLVGGLRIMDGALTIGMLVAFQGLMVAFSLPVKQVIDASAKIQEAQGLLYRLDDVMRQSIDAEFEQEETTLELMGRQQGAAAVDEGSMEEARRQESAFESDSLTTDFASEGLSPGRHSAELMVPRLRTAKRRKLGGGLEMRQICFGFNPLDPPWIDGFDLSVAPGGWVALVGPSGSGKSTLGRMIAGVVRPWSGDIWIDGQKLVEIPRQVLRNTVAVVDQNISLFEGTVAENIAMWDATLPEARMVEAARDAGLHDEIAARPGGYRELIEEGGRNFSGGERQRIEIARALVAEPSILLLDEATSALDARTENGIIRNLRRRGQTCVLIAHRLSTIRDCDEIIVLDAGQVVERGDHRTLMERDGAYRKLVHS